MVKTLNYIAGSLYHIQKGCFNLTRLNNIVPLYMSSVKNMAIRHKYSRVRKLYSVIVNYYNKHISHITIISHRVNMKNVELSSRIEQAQSTLF